MKTVSRRLHLLAPLALALAAAGTMPAQQTYTYTLNLPDISGVTENDNSFFQYEFSWLGPLEFNAPAGSSCPDGCPVTGTTPGAPAAGYSYAGVFFTASTNAVACSGSPSGGCSEIDLSFTQPNNVSNPAVNSIIASNFIGFRLIEPDSFWLNPATNLSFADNPLGENGVGASFLVSFSGGSNQSLNAAAPAETGCSQCSVTIAAATPEPGTWLLLAGSLAVLGVVFGRQTLRSV